MQGLVTVFGGSGFVGRYAVRAMAKAGWRIRVAMRRPHLGPELRVMGDVGQIELVQANVRDADSVARALDQAEACVNLVGILSESGRQRFAPLQATAPGTIARAAATEGCTRFVQVSAIGSDASSTSEYARTKAAGEAGVFAAFPTAAVLRPSIVFGPEDDFFNRFGQMASFLPALPLIGGGKTLFQPVYAGDVGAAVAACVADAGLGGRVYELGGPATHSFRELMEMLCREVQRTPALVPIPFPVARLMGQAFELPAKLLPMAPVITRDQVELLKSDNVVAAGMPGLADLGVTPTAMDAVLPSYLWKFRPGGQFALPEAADAKA